MKFMKKISIIAVAAFMTISAVGCGTKSETPSAKTEGQQTAATPEEKIKAATEKMASIENMNALMSMNMEMSSQGQGIKMSSIYDITYFANPMKMKMDMTVDAGEQGKQSLTAYIDSQDSKYYMYMTDGSQWMSQELPTENFAQYNAKDSMEMYLSSGSEFKDAGVEQVNGKDTDKLEGVISGDALKETMDSAGIENSLKGSGLDDATIKAMLEEIKSLPITLWVDKESGYPVKYEMNMKDMMQSMMDKALEMSNAPAEQKITVVDFSVKMECSSFNEAEDFEIPAEAKQAA